MLRRHDCNMYHSSQWPVVVSVTRIKLRCCCGYDIVSKCHSFRFVAILIIMSHMVAFASCAQSTQSAEEGIAPGDPLAHAGGSPQGKGDVSESEGGKVPPVRVLRADKLMDPSLLTSEYSTFDGDGLPGTQEEFKIEVPPAKEECFFQWMKIGTRLHSSFQVLRGADLNLDFSLRNPDGIIIHIEPWTSRGRIESVIIKEGVYALCLGNNMSKFSRKLVHIFFQTQTANEWHNYTAAIVEYQTELLNITKSLQNVQTRITNTRATQATYRMNLLRDHFNVNRLRETVQLRSLILCLVIVIISIFQVFFVRRLFRYSVATPTAKPRA